MTWITTEDGTPIITADTGEVLVVALPPPNATPPLGSIIPAYPYAQYADDPNVVAFFAAYNTIAQSYLDWLNVTPLPIYTNPNINGPLLDWIAGGIYGIQRPVFSSLTTMYRAGVNSFALNTQPLNGEQFSQSGTAVTANDDYYKRVLTWFTYLGDGPYFNVQLLRWRVARFLYGPNGTDVTIALTQGVHLQPELLPQPPAPALSWVMGGALSSRTYAARYTYVTPIGETVAGLTASLTVPVNNRLHAASPPPANGAQSYNVYVAEVDVTPGKFLAGLNAFPVNGYAINGGNNRAATPMYRQNVSPIPIGTGWTEAPAGLLTGIRLPSSDTSNLPTNVIVTIPSGPSASIFEQAMNQGILSFPLQLSATVVLT